MESQRKDKDTPFDIGSRLELFVDDVLIDTMTDGLSLKLHSPIKAERVLENDRPWEGNRIFYVSVFKDEDRFRMYYRGGLGERGITARVCYAWSRDGIHWEKPELNLLEFEGSTRNNIVWNGVGSPCALGAFFDTNPDCTAEERYKAISSDGYQKPVFAFGPPDAVRWHLIGEKPVIDEYDGVDSAYDCNFSTWWDPECKRYVMFHRIWYRPIKGKVRSIAMRTSEDFINWTPLQRLDFGDAPVENLYTNSITPYFRAPHILFGFPKRFITDRRGVSEHETDGLSDAMFMSSRDGLHFDRRFMEAFIRPGRERLNWGARSNMIAYGLLPTAPDEISVYIVQHYTRPSVHLKRCVLRTDGFVSVNALYRGGELLTRPLIFDGRELVINYATSGAGSVRVEITDQEGSSIPGFEADNCPEIFGDDIERVVRWSGGSDVRAFAGKPVRLRFLLKDADLYSIRFRPFLSGSVFH